MTLPWKPSKEYGGNDGAGELDDPHGNGDIEWVEVGAGGLEDVHQEHGNGANLNTLGRREREQLESNKKHVKLFFI